jgi:clathrin heavy chain
MFGRVCLECYDCFATGAASLIELFEGENCYEGLFHYLRSVVDSSDDADVHYKYIQAAVKLGQNKEIERICRKSTCYDAERVKNFLKDANLPDQLPLIIVCDRHGFVHDLVMHLYRHNLTHYIEIYVQKVNTSRLPTVVGALLDVDCSEDFIKNLISSVPSSFDIAELTNEIEKRNKLRLILPWLESKVSQGSQDPGIHTALAKIYIDSNQNAERFLTENHYYDPLLVGRYSSRRDPHLAFIAFRRGRCDADILQLCQENAMFKNEARYLVSRRDLDLWAKVLDKSNPFRRQVIDQVVQTALPETQEAEDVLTTVKAFLTAALPDELLDLLEKLVLENTSLFGSNRSLQNLLLLTAIKADSCKVIDFINRCDNYDAPEIAREALESGLFEEAFTIYKKFDDAVAAMQVLINNIGDVERASEFANNCHQPEVYSLLAKAQLDKLLLTDAIHSYIAAGDPSNYKEVVDVAGRLGEYTELLKFLVMAKSKLREPFIEAELVYVLAKCERLSELEDFLSGPNVLAQLQNVGERCYNDGLYAASKIIFRSVSNYAFLALTSIRLGDLQTAVDCAKKAKSTKTWRDVCFACVEAKDFRLAQFCGQNLAVHTDELERLIHFYSSRGYFLELIDLLDSALGSDRAHMGMFTELAVLYAFHAPERLLSYLSMFWSRVNLPKVLRATERAHLWKELAFLYVKYADWDNAARLAMAHPTEAWKHSEFKEIISKVGASELYYKALQFYIDYAPTLLSELMNAILSKIDHVRAVKFFQKTESLALVKNYLVSVQDRNIEAVNEVIHTMYIDEENPDMLRLSTEKYDNFDKIALAKKLENHEQLEFRRIAAFLYKSAKRWDLALTLCKSDSLLSDAIEYTAELANPESAEDLLKYFIEQKNYVCYAACLYTCFHVLRPDVVLEYAWRHQLMDYTMPYLIQIMKNYGDKVHELSAFHQTKLAEERRAEKVPQPLLLDNDRLMITHGPVNGSGINVNDAAAGSFLSTGLPVKAWDAK